jgi:hypothetical protein
MPENPLCAATFHAVSDHLSESAHHIGGAVDTVTLYFLQGKLGANEHERLKFHLLKAQHILEKAHDRFLSSEPSGGLFEAPNNLLG